MTEHLGHSGAGQEDLRSGEPSQVSGDKVGVAKKGDPCQNCRQRPSTTQYVGDGGALALTHGFYQWWCDVCVLTEQLEHARERAAAIPDLQRQLRNAKRRKS